MTRVAICLSGLPRMNFTVTAKKWKEVIDRYNADVFVHTWILDQDIRKDVQDQIQNLYKPRAIKFEGPRTYPLEEYRERIWPTVIPYNVFSAYASIYECQNLVNHYSYSKGFVYDYVIRGRFDVLVNGINLEPVDGVAVPDDPDKHCLKFSYNGQSLFGVNDLLAYGSQEAMSIYSNTFYQIPTLYKIEGIDMCSELFLTSNLVKHQVPIVFKPMKTAIIRR